MKNALLITTLSVGLLTSKATIHTVQTTGSFTFNPPTTNAVVGDTVRFIIGAGHTGTEVSAATWAINGNTPLSGGFNFTSGTHDVKLTMTGTRYFVCSPHSSMGMKGQINVSLPPWAYLGEPGFSSDVANYQSMVVGSDGTPYVVYNDTAYASAGRAEARKFDGTNWVLVGTGGFTGGSATYGSLAIDADDNLYFSFSDGNTGNLLSVMKYDGTSWAYLGAPGISADAVTETTIRIADDGTPYVCYLDAAPSNVCVKKYNGTAWVNVGPAAEISPAGAIFPSMELDSNGNPWIAYGHGAMGPPAANVMRYDGTTWSQVGSPGFSGPMSSVAIFTDIAISDDDEVYVAYANAMAGQLGNVRKFDGVSNWDTIGGANFTPGSTTFNTLAIDVNGVVYLSFMDGSVPGSKGSVMQYNEAVDTWVYVGTAGFTGAGAGYLGNALDGNTYMYVTATDGDHGGRTSVMYRQFCIPAADPVLTASATSVCIGEEVTLNVSGALNNDTGFEWYTGSCHGTSVGSGTGLVVTINDTTTFYSSGEGGCVFAGDQCNEITIIGAPLPTATITQAGFTLTSTPAASYQWLFNGAPISGANGVNHTATANGNYSVVVTNSSGCTDTSNVIAISTIGINELNSGAASIYPVPFSTTLHIDLLASANGNYDLNITDPQGRVVYNQNQIGSANAIDLSHLINGVYFVTLQHTTGKAVYRVVKQ